MSRRCVILGAAPVSNPQKLASLLRPDDMVIAADGGYQLAECLGVHPSMLVADFDSAEKPAYIDAAVYHLPIRKDVTDTAAAVDRALSAGVEDFLFIGCLGGRLDHEFANYQLLARLSSQGCHAIMVDEHNRIEVMTNSPVKVSTSPGEKLSLFAFGGAVTDLSIHGAAYSLEDYYLQPEDSLCISNEAPNGCEITFGSGALLLFFSND